MFQSRRCGITDACRLPNLFRTGADAMEPQQRDQRRQADVLPTLLAIPSVHVIKQSQSYVTIR